MKPGWEGVGLPVQGNSKWVSRRFVSRSENQAISLAAALACTPVRLSEADQGGPREGLGDRQGRLRSGGTKAEVAARGLLGGQVRGSPVVEYISDFRFWAHRVDFGMSAFPPLTGAKRKYSPHWSNGRF